MKKILSVILCLCILVSIFYVPVSAKSPVNIFNVTVEVPEAGNKPDYNASVPETASTKVVKVEWEGGLDENGCFKNDTEYTMYATVRLLDEHKDTKYIKYVEDTVKVNGKVAKLKDISEDKTQAVVYYTFKPGEAGTETSGTEEVSKHMHCYCGGYIENTGDHTSHKTVAYKAWPEDGKIKYNNGVAHIYLEQDVFLDSTLKIGNGKTLYLCLNGYALVMKPEGQSVVNVSGNANLYLCNCTRGEGGQIAFGKVTYGAGIYNSGTVRMYGGIITQNEAGYGAGVWNGSKFYLYGGDIYDNDATAGGGVWNNDGATFEMYNGTVSLNVASTGGGIWDNGGTLVLKGGNIQENVAGVGGGGIWNNGGKMEMDGSFILANFSQYGGGLWNNGGIVEIKSGNISKNVAGTDPDQIDGYGGGVWNNDDGVINMTGGEITFNKAAFGGGVWCNPDSDFMMTGGVVAENEAINGGGIYVSAKGSHVATYQTPPLPGRFILAERGGILMNYARQKGGGAYVEGILEISGDTDIDLNICETDPDSSQIHKEPDGQITKNDPMPTQFADVDRDAYYVEPVKWAVEKEITNGTSDATFSPDAECSTAQILTFLWRAAGSPTVTKPFPYADVYESDYFYMAAQWAKKKDMVEHYALYPNYSCNRMMAVYYIWCAAGKPSCKTPIKFTDTKDSSYEKYYEAIAWAVDNGITNGTSDTTFSPGNTCTRAQIVTFLWRAAQKGLI